jgi:pimeloyl-ACP methyl ester carboxylesterase
VESHYWLVLKCSILKNGTKNNTGEPVITTRDFRWSWQGQDLVIGLDEDGDGALILLLPALSSISTRGEMRPLMERLASQFRVVAIDWPGFGTRPRPNVHWTPDALSNFLEHVLDQIVSRPHGIVAAGHAATYVLDCATRRSGITDRLVLIAPTWRGPLPTVAGGDRPLFAKIRSAIETPGIGSLLYRLNVNSFVVSKMVAGHVYSDPTWLSGERLIEKRQVMDAPGARFASVAFVTGALDRVSSRADFLALVARAAVPIFLIYGAETPSRSRAEMDALAAVPGVRTERLPRGKLSVHEEFPDDVASFVGPFLSNLSS